jgi:thiamine-monophosphate kinase
MKLGEFELINKLTKKLPCPSEKVVVGIGDDAAVVKLNGSYQIITSDALIENSHYKREWIGRIPELYYYLGRKLLSISVSDIASMGGTPEYAVITIGLSQKSRPEDIEALYDGLADCCREYSVTVLGGDTVSSKTEFFDLTLIGKCNRFMVRSKASPGDLVAVTGTLGDSKAGLETLLKNLTPDHYLLERFLNPAPRIEEGLEAVRLGVKCSTDVSDGLVFNLYTIADVSKVSIHIEKRNIPISQNLVNFTGNPEIALDYALFGGEDYELIITFPESLQDRIENVGFKVIGRVKSGRGVFLDGEKLPKKGLDHFRRNS